MDEEKPDPWEVVRALGEAQAGVVSRRQLYAAGLTRWLVKGQLKAGRWQRAASQSVCLHNGPLTEEAHWWIAVFEGGPRAQLDGSASLVASGLKRFTVDRIRVSVPRGSPVRRSPSYDIRQTRRWSAGDRAATGVPRTRTPVAAVRAALWAVSDKQATYVLTLPVQQGMTTVEAIGAEAIRIKRDKRRVLIQSVLGDLLDGARSLGELEVGRELARRGLPQPTRQELRQDKRKRYYLDLYWHGVATGRRGGRHPPHVGAERRRRRASTEHPGHRWRHGAAATAAGSSAVPGRVLRPDRRGTGRQRLDSRCAGRARRHGKRGPVGSFCMTSHRRPRDSGRVSRRRGATKTALTVLVRMPRSWSIDQLST